MKDLVRLLWRDERGQDLVEYGLLLVLVSLSAIAGMSSLASAINSSFGSATANLTSS